MKNLRVFEIKFLGPTNVRGSRLKITDTRFGTSVTLSKSYNFNDITDQAIEFLKAKGIKITARAENTKTGISSLMSENFTDQIK